MATIQGVYLALFGRPADPAGLAYWNGVTGNGADLTAIRGLAQQPEYLDRFDNFTSAEIVTAIYQSLFGRDPEPEGLNFFVAELDSGRQSIETIAINILDGAQASDASTIANKLSVSSAFTAFLDAQDLSEIYVGNAAAEYGRRHLVSVTDDTRTVELALGTVGALPAGVTTKFFGELSEQFTDGTLLLDTDSYLDSTTDDPDGMIVGGGADLVVDGDFTLRGDGGAIAVSGAGTTVSFSNWTSIAGGPGLSDESIFTIADDAQVTMRDGLSLGHRSVFTGDDGSQINDIGGNNTGILNISTGGRLTIDGFANFASYFAQPDDLNDGTETSTAFVTVVGQGSVLDLREEHASFATTRGGVAHLTIADGGAVLLASGGSFGDVDDDTTTLGGEAYVYVSGPGSRMVNSGVDGLGFGRGSGSYASLNVSDGGLVSSAEFLGFGRDGGTADVGLRGGGSMESVFLHLGTRGGQGVMTIDGSTLLLAGQDAAGQGAYLTVGMNASTMGASEMLVTNGGDVIIDGEGSFSPGFRVGRDGGQGTIRIDGIGSTFTVTGDDPDTVNPDGASGASFSGIGRGAGSVGTFEVTNGGAFQNSATGTIDIGRNEANGTLLVDGNGSLFGSGDYLRIGHENGQGRVIVSNSGSLRTEDTLFDGEEDISIRESGELLVSQGASLRGDVGNRGLFSVQATSSSNGLEGDFRQSADGVLDFEIAGAAGSAALTISGQVFLDGEINIDMLAGHGLAAGAEVILLDAAQGLSVGSSFDVTFSGLDASLDAQVVIADGTATLLIGVAGAFADNFAVA